MTPQRLPLYLLTGPLGSGKTTLLASWLGQPELAGAAVIVNELGQVGLDNRLLGPVADVSALVSGGCVCCTGLPGLEEALADMYWGRLERRLPRFPAVVIETTGVAEPAPVLQVLQRAPLLRERYRLAGVVTTLGANNGARMLEELAHARAQVQAADVVVLTKLDQTAHEEQARVQALVSRVNPTAAQAGSARAGLTAAEMMTLLPRRGRLPPAEPTSGGVESSAASPPEPESAAVFVGLSRAVDRRVLAMRLQHWAQRHGGGLLRAKGVVLVDAGTRLVLQWSLGDSAAEMAPYPLAGGAADTVALGLTVIARPEAIEAAASDLMRALHGLP